MNRWIARAAAALALQPQNSAAHPLPRRVVAVFSGAMFSIALCLTTALAAGTFSPEARAQAATETGVRNFPRTALRGTLVVLQPPAIQMNGNAMRLSPGARIHATNNSLVFSAQIVGQELVVNYTLEPGGMVHEVWILTPQEAALKRPNTQQQGYGSRYDTQSPTDDGKTPYNQLPGYGAQTAPVAPANPTPVQ